MQQRTCITLTKSYVAVPWFNDDLHNTLQKFKIAYINIVPCSFWFFFVSAMQ